MRKYFIQTLGCQMNKNDSERASQILQNLGMEETNNPELADFILINSCSVRQAGEDRVFGLMKKFNEFRKNNPCLVLGITGCMAGRDRDGILRKKFIFADLFFSTSDMVRLPEWLCGFFPDLNNTPEFKNDYLSIAPFRKTNFQSFVSIQTGCNKFCAYCVVPFARGFEYNRKAEDILNECNELARNKCLEITLLGQVVNAYQAPDIHIFNKNNPYSNHFAALLWEINQIDGIKRIHYTAPHPLHMDEEVIDALALNKHLKYLHLPAQAGSDEMLKKMNRRHNRDYYIGLINKIRACVPDIALGTDLIVGFCGETEEMFNDTIDLYKKCDFDISYPAMYSQRPGTVAQVAFEDDVAREEKKRRWRVVQNLMEETTLRKNQKFVGQTVSVLADDFKEIDCGKGFVMGNSEYMKRVRFYGEKDMIGKIHNIVIHEAKTWILYGDKI